MEFIIGFIMGLILAQAMASSIYKKSLDEIQSRYKNKITEIMELLNEYNR